MLKEGDLVKVMIPLSEHTASKRMVQFNGKVGIIKEDIARRMPSNQIVHTFTLNGFVGANGKHFEFFEDWLIPQDEV